MHHPWPALWISAWLSVTLASPSANAEELLIGSISELDLSELSRVAERGEEKSLPAREHLRRLLSLEQALEAALEKNLRLEIARLDVHAQAPEVDATRAKFHPTFASDGLIVESKQDINQEPMSVNPVPPAEPDPMADEETTTYDARVFLRQQLPTGGTLSFGGEYNREEPPDDPDDPDPNVEIYGAFVELRQPLLRGGRWFVARRMISDAEFDLEIQQARLAAEVLLVTAETKEAYYNTVLAARLIEVVRAAVARGRKLVEASNALFEGGRVTKRDVFSAEIQLASDLSDLARREADLESAQNRLRDVLGLPIDLYLEVTDRHIPFRPIEFRLDAWIKSALERRPELLAVRKRLEKAELETRIRGNDVLPTFDIFGNLLHDVRPNETSRDWQAGFLFEIPIGNVAARRRFDSAKFRQSRVEREYKQEERRIELEVREIEIRLRESLQRVVARIQGTDQARNKREIAQARFERGLANNLDITDADQDLVSAETDLLQAVVDYANRRRMKWYKKQIVPASSVSPWFSRESARASFSYQPCSPVEMRSAPFPAPR
jgi:outer membrane protein TolC